MAQLIKDKKIKRTDLLLDAANGGAIIDVTKPAVTTTEMAFAQAPIETASTKTSNATVIPTTQYSGMPTSAYQQMMGTYEPQLTAPLTEKVTPKTITGTKTDPRPTTVTTQPTTRTTTTVKNPRITGGTPISNYDKLVKASDSGKQIVPLETVQEPIKEGAPIDKIKEAAGVTEPTHEKDLTDLANENYAKEYEDREEATLSNSEEANNSPSEKEKIDEQLQQGYSEHYEDLDESNKDIPEVKPEPTPEPKKEEGNGEVDWNSSDNPYLTKSEQLQKIIDEINTENEKRKKEYEDALKAKDDAYNELKQNSIDLLKGNNDEAWRDQKERINQSAANYRAELDAINKKSSMYYDNYLDMLGLKGSGAGAGLYNDMAVQNANVATQIEANRQNEIENARQANTDKLMALLEQAQKDGITLSDEEMKDILGTYSKDSLAAGTDAEATRWNRYNNLVNAKNESDKAEAKAQEELNNKDSALLSFYNNIYEGDYTTEQINKALEYFNDDTLSPTQQYINAMNYLRGEQEATETSQSTAKDELTLQEKQTQLANMKTVATEQPDEFKAAITYYGTSLGSNPNTATGNTVNTALDVVKNSQKMYTNAEFMGSDLAEKYFNQNATYEVDKTLNSGLKIKENYKMSDEEKNEAFKDYKPILEKAFNAAKEGKLPDGTTIIPKRNKNDNYGVAYTYIGGYWYVGKCAWNADGVMTKEQLDKVIQ